MTRHAVPFLPPLASAAFAALALAGCSPAEDSEESISLMTAHEQTDKAAYDRAMRTAKDDCLLLVWSEQKSRDVEFDRKNDAAEGGAISCATGTSASQFEAAIEAIRAAAKSGDKARMLEEIGIPMLYIDGEGERRPLEDRATIDQLFDEVFDQRMLDMLQRLDLSDMTVVPDQGAFFELGSLWLVVDKEGGRPRILTVNRQALDDAADAAKDMARRKGGKEVPLSSPKP